MQIKTTFLSLLVGVLCTVEMSGQAVLAPTLLSASNAFQGYMPHDFCSRGENNVHFLADPTGSNVRQLWQTNGTAAGTQTLTNFTESIQRLGASPGMLYFSTGVRAHKLYGASGAVNATWQIQTELIIPIVDHGAVLGNNMVIHDTRKMVITNGSSPTITLGTFENIPLVEPCAWNGKVYFAASLPGSGMELFVTDGTVAGTVLFKDICPGATGSDPRDLTIIGNKLYFTAVSVAGGKRELWVSSGLSFNTMKIKEVGPVTGKLLPLVPNSNAFPQKFYFATNNDPNNYAINDAANGALWESDGTPEGTKKLTFANLRTKGFLEVMPMLDGKVRFFANDLVNVRNMYRMVPATTGLLPTPATAVVEVNPPSGQATRAHGVCNGKLFYTTDSGNTAKLWAYNGSNLMQVRPSNTQISWDVSASPADFHIRNGWLYFNADSGGGGFELYRVQ